MTIQTTNIDVTTGDAFDLTVAEQAYIVDSGVSVLAEEGGQNGISSVFDFNEIMNYGQVSAPNDGIHMGSGGEGGQIVNEASGSITANSGIVVETADNYIENDGRISAFSIGIDDDASSGNDIFNTGSILAKGTGIDADSDDFVDNTGTIRSDSIGVALNAGTGAISLTNAGAIHGSLESVQSSGASAVSIVNRGALDGNVELFDAGGDAFTNTGTIDGNVQLGNGTNTFDNRHGGRVTGTITGGSGADTIYLGNDGETVNGGLGHDVIYGGAGADTFVFTSDGTANADGIRNINVNNDLIELSHATFAKLTAGQTPVFSIGAAATSASDHLYYNSTGGGLWYDPDGSGSQAAVVIANLGAGLKLTAKDFTVV
jgi:serralysin